MVRIDPPQQPAIAPGAGSDPTHADAKATETYTRTGPGPIASIRMRWTARAVGSIAFVVDEVMGDDGMPVTSGPMSREAAIKLIDERAQAAHDRYAELRSELAWPDDKAPDEPPGERAAIMPPGPPPVD